MLQSRRHNRADIDKRGEHDIEVSLRDVPMGKYSRVCFHWQMEYVGAWTGCQCDVISRRSLQRD